VQERNRQTDTHDYYGNADVTITTGSFEQQYSNTYERSLGDEIIMLNILK